MSPEKIAIICLVNWSIKLIGGIFILFQKICRKGQKSKPTDINRNNIKQGQALHEVSHGHRRQKPGHKRMFAQSSLPKLPVKGREHGKIREETNYAGLGQIVENNAMGPVKPGFPIFPGREVTHVKIFIEHRGEIFRAPAQNRPVLKALPGATPGPKSGLCRILAKIQEEQATTRHLLNPRFITQAESQS